jgi:hypothetical protein
MPSLSVRAEKAQEALFQRYDELNKLWKEAEKQLSRWHVPKPVQLDIGSDDPAINYFLYFGKDGGKWRIYYGWESTINDDENEIKLIDKCSAEDRVRLAKHLPALREKVVESAEKFVQRVDRTIAKMKEELATMDKEHLKSLLSERAKLNGKA